MNKTIKKAGILLAVFVAAAVVYFFWPVGGKQEEDLTYAAVQEATLPVVYPQMNGREMAPLFGHREEMAVTADRGSLLVLPADRRLSVSMEYAEAVSALRYEIRSMDGSRLIERTEISGWERQDGEISAVLPIQNLLEEGTEYQLGLCAELSDGSAAWYYARILETDDSHAEEMLALAEEFSRKTFNYEEAQSLTMYMESVPEADNSTFGNVTLKCSFSQITWGDLDAEQAGPVRITLKDLYGNMANIQLDYVVRRQSEGTEELFSVTENFTMKWSAQRIYIMDYQRTMNQLFSGASELFSGKRIILGISSGEDIYAVKSSGGRYTAFVVNRELWTYDNEENRSVRVFAFGGGDMDDPRANHGSHGVEILTVQDDGQMDFLVYGYMNRGNHEGYTGVSLYHYDSENNTIMEQFFIPASESYETLKEDVERLSHKGENGILYLYLDGSVYGVDMTSYEYVVVASGLTEETFAVSKDRSRLAWQEGGQVFDSRMIYVMDLNTGERAQIGDGNSKTHRLLGFVGNDCIYGSAEPGNYILSNGRIKGLFLESLDILDKDMKNAMHYEEDGYYIRSAEVDESRIHIQRVRERSGGFYAETEEDTLVCNAEMAPDRTEEIGWYTSEEKGRIYFVQLEGAVPAGERVRAATPKKMTSGETNILNLQDSKPAETMEFYAYGRGSLAGLFTSFAGAVDAVYDSMGFVTDENGAIFWSRGDKASVHTIRNSQAAVMEFEKAVGEGAGNRHLENGSVLLDATGCTLDQVLYFVDQDMPVLAYVGEGSRRYLTGYDQNYVTFYDPDLGTAERMDLEQAEFYLRKLGNDFVCYIPAE